MYPTIVILGKSLSAYYICIVLGIFLIITLASSFRPKDFPLASDALLALLCLAAIAGFVGTKLLYLATHSWLYKDPRSFALAFFCSGGYAYLGVPLSVAFMVWIAAKIEKVSFLVLADFLFSFLMAERVVGRLGCLLGGCCYGIECKLPWAINARHVSAVHPTQAYEMIYALAIFVSARYLYNKLASVKGLTFFYVIFSYSAFRFFNEFIRHDGRPLFGFFKLPNAVFLALSLISFYGILRIVKKSGRKDEVLPALKTAVKILFITLAITAVIILSVISLISH